MNLKTSEIMMTEIITNKEIISDSEIIIKKEVDIIEKEITTEIGILTEKRICRGTEIIKNIDKPTEILKKIMIAILKEFNKSQREISKDNSEDSRRDNSEGLLEDKKDNSIKNN